MTRARSPYLHPQFVPRRDNRFDYDKPVDGSDPRTDWRGLHALSELPSVLRPPNGWVVNTNDWPYRAAGAYSPTRSASPNIWTWSARISAAVTPRGCSKAATAGSLEGLQAAAFDSFQPGFAELIPELLRAYDGLPALDPRRARLAQPIAVLRPWNYRWSAESVAQTVASLWGGALVAALHPSPDEDSNLYMTRLGRDTTRRPKAPRAR